MCCIGVGGGRLVQAVEGNPRLRLPCLINLHLAHSALAAAFSSKSAHNCGICRPTSAPLPPDPGPRTPTPRHPLQPTACWLLTVLAVAAAPCAPPARPLHKPTAKCCFCRSIYVDCNFQLCFTQIHTHTHTHADVSVHVCASTRSSHCNCCDYYRFNSAIPWPNELFS